MSADPQAVQALFAQAIEIADQSAREKFLSAECAGNPELYQRVVKLLMAFDGSKGFLDQPTKASAETQLHAVSAHQPGQLIAGRYKLLEAIGEGGMGTVWVAEQTQPIRRKVALKLVKPGMDTKQVLARFDAERQALALMDHPNIARVFDGGVTDQGRPFFAMELVKGMPLTEYCDQMRLPIEERLKLFVPICQAVQHAHQKGVVHRDLKPSNVLICLYDGKPVPKVIDFGLAKAMHQPLTEQTVHTGFGLMIGTPLYMSPEQAEHNNLDVDTRTDVYSLGVMLYELLTGSTPLEKAQFKDAAFGEILRLIKEVEPPKPSTRVSTSARLPNIAAQRNLDPDKLGRSIRGDLDWIVMKAIDKERVRRYETASGLARDIERFLNLEAVEACPPSTAYRFRRLVRKHRTAITSAIAFATVLILGAGLSIWQAYRATKAESRTLVEQRKTQAALETSQQNEKRALESQAEAIAARKAEERAKLAEAQQRKHAEQQRDEAQRLQREATAKSNELLELTEQQRRVIYTSEMSQVRIEAQRGNLARMREILLDQLPIDGKPDLRGFEWNYWYRYLNQAEVITRFDKAAADTRGCALVTVLPGARQVAWTEGDSTEVVDLENGMSRRFPFPQRLHVDRTQYSETGRAAFGACLSHTFPPGIYRPPGVDQGSSNSCSIFDPTGLMHTLEYPPNAFSHVSAISISPDGKQAVVIGYDSAHSKANPVSRMCVWEVDSQKLILNRTYPLELNRVSFSTNGKKLAAHLCHGTQRQSDTMRTVAVVLEAATGEQLASLEHDDDIDSVYWLPDSARLLLGTLGFSGANRKQLYRWETQGADSKLVLLTRETLPDYVIGVVSPDGSTLATTSHTTTRIRLFDTTHGDLLETIHTDGRGLVSLAYSGDGRQLTATTNTGEVLRWELGKNSDLFALRTKPLSKLASNGYALSPDQSHLAIALADGTVLTRSRDGHETVLRRGAASKLTWLKISPDNQFLAYCRDGNPQNAAPSDQQALLEMYDIRAGRKIWSTQCSRPLSSDLIKNLSVGNTPLEFEPDSKRLAIAGGSQLTVFESQTGKGTAYDLRNDGSSLTFFALSRNPMTGIVHALHAETERSGNSIHFSTLDPFTLTKIHDVVVNRSSLANIFPLSLDGKFCAFGGLLGVLEIWDLERGEQILSPNGRLVVFSPDPHRVAVLDYETPKETVRYQSVSVWDLESRQKLCDLPLAEDLPTEVRFSSDGARLLTLHAGETVRGRLWDVEAGREILDLPVAEENHYAWDLFFDASGNQLTQLLFTKPAGTIGGGATAFYDARPLDASFDNDLAAVRLLEMLMRSHALKHEWIAEIESRSGLIPGIRDAALRKARETIVNPNEIAKKTSAIVGSSDRTMEDYQRAITWAEELRRLEPSAIRSRLLLGAAYFRSNRLQEALSLVSGAGPSSDAAVSDTEKRFEMARRAVQALVYFRMGKSTEAQNAFELKSLMAVAKSSPLKPTDRIEDYWLYIQLVAEATRLIPQRLAPMDLDSNTLSEGKLKSYSRSLMGPGNSMGDLSKYSRGFGFRLIPYDVNHDGLVSETELVSAINDSLRYAPPITILGVSLETKLEFLDETIEKVPRYLSARFARAWILATSPDEKLRQPAKALDDAKAICEQTNYRDAAFLEALAAAYAANNDYSSAAHWQAEAIRHYGEANLITMLQDLNEDPNQRLATYKSMQPYRTSRPPFNVDWLLIPQRAPKRESDVSVVIPLLDPDFVASSRRIEGRGAAWSPDGTQLLRMVKTEQSAYAIECIDLATGESSRVCSNGYYPVWAGKPFNRIFFARGPEDASRNMLNESIWQCDPNGDNVTRVTDGGYASLLQDGSLIVTRRKAGPPPSAVMKGFRFDETGKCEESGLEHASSVPYPKISPNGKLIVEAKEFVRVSTLEPRKEIHVVDMKRHGLRYASGDWSPDSRYYAYTNADSKEFGIWIIDATSGENRLLTDVNASNPHWSPNGSLISVDERSTNTIIILDVSSLKLEQGLDRLR